MNQALDATTMISITGSTFFIENLTLTSDEIRGKQRHNLLHRDIEKFLYHETCRIFTF